MLKEQYKTDHFRNTLTCSGLSLSRTRKGPINLFEIEKVRDRENYRKNENFY